MTTYTASHDCGWTGGPYRSPAQAEYALRRHSCEKARARAESAARGQARRDAVDRTPKPCSHPAGHRHGTYVAYTIDYCRCLPCTRAAAAYERQRIRRNAYGRSDLVDAEPIRDHVRSLMAAGIGLKQITRHTGVNGGVMSKLMYGIPEQRPPARRVRKATAAKLLALRPTQALLPDGARVPSIGTARRVQALVAVGWSVQRICEHAGLDRQRVDGALRGRDVLHGTARSIRATYDALWNAAPPATTRGERTAAARSRARAAFAGWAPPMAWDDDTIDDPSATPDTGARARSATDARRGRSSSATVEDIDFLLSHDPALTLGQIADRIHVTKEAIHHACNRAGRPDLPERLRRNAQLARKGSAA